MKSTNSTAINSKIFFFITSLTGFTQQHAQSKLTSSCIAVLCALFFSAFIYLDYFLDSGYSPFYSSVCAFLGLFFYFKLSRFGAFICGGIIGILWFYWVGFSFRFYEMTFLIPLVWVVFFLVYGVLFLLFCYFYNPLYRILTLTLSSFIHPFGFNWFLIELIFVKSYFFPSKLTLVILLFGILIFSFFLAQKFYKTSILWLLILCFLTPSNTESHIQNSSLNIKTTTFNIPQNLRWNPNELQEIVEQNFKEILSAKQEQYDIVILPETAFPTPLNLQPFLLETLKDFSQDIAILVGGIYKETNDSQSQFYNSAYLFQNGEMQVFHKLILVPFGEQIPLPRFLTEWINKVFFNKAEDFSAQQFTAPNSATIKNQKFQIAICYEATREEFYQDSPRNLIAISNNAWFQPSIEPTLQKLLMLYFSKNHNTSIYHSSNASGNFTLP